MLPCTPVLLIVDYNLSRIGDVSHMRNYARKQWGAQTWLVRANPQGHDTEISDRVIDADPLDPGFINHVLSQLGKDGTRITAGIVFSDNAVVSGSMLLERLGLSVDDATLALGAFDKLAYRITEERIRPQLNLMGIISPDFVRINCLSDLRNFAAHQKKGFVIKPACEGNNRGVVMVEPGGDCEQAFLQVTPYLEKGVLAETFITFTREYSYDGLGCLWFITEKVSAKGRYPVEVAQILPARLCEEEILALRVAGEQVNQLVGQRLGPFHNEIKLSDSGYRTAVVEPNRRPGGMKIWTLAHAVYGVDLYAAWIDSAFEGGGTGCACARCMQCCHGHVGCALRHDGGCDRTGRSACDGSRRFVVGRPGSGSEYGRCRDYGVCVGHWRVTTGACSSSGQQRFFGLCVCHVALRDGRYPPSSRSTAQGVAGSCQPNPCIRTQIRGLVLTPAYST